MDRDRAYLVATPFKKRDKKTLKISDFVFAISLDLKWGPPEKVRALLQEAADEGLVRIEGDYVHSAFEEGQAEVPLGFSPQKEEDLFEKAVRLIVTSTGMGRREVISMVNERQDSLMGLVNLEAVALLVAKEMGVEVRELTDLAYRNLIEEAKQGHRDGAPS
ncbi:MAG: hypothetical protein A4E50_00155 [Methanosaeta sp. PtaB.Bin087]|nr:DUF2240 family protein [Methanothrix sp.]OPX82683.1 MAG: hypothetical protein A4E50_00155 [Methanosaeta sp. PtaB.Bin087]